MEPTASDGPSATSAVPAGAAAAVPAQAAAVPETVAAAEAAVPAAGRPDFAVPEVTAAPTAGVAAPVPETVPAPVAVAVAAEPGPHTPVPVPAAAPPPVIPAPPTVPPRIPAPSRPADAVPGRAAVPPAPSHRPFHADAPGLNWAGPGDRWSRAWSDGLPALPPPAPLPQTAPSESADRPPTPRDLALIRDTLAVVEPVADRATAHFYALLFVHHPEVRALFPAAMDVQRDRLFHALLMAARSAHDPAGLTEYLSALGRGHRKYGTLEGHYGPVGECLIAAVAKYCGSHWDAEAELAWRRVYGLVSRIMIDAAARAARTSPAWWQGEVVSHERRSRDVAVLTLRPDQAYPYRAGQYAAVETPWWPRVWRSFSFATAPRPDGLLTLHVKAVQAGWVSTALVRRASPGDVLRLGPAAGGMVLDHARGADLLCLGGGTGIAPVTAMVEEVAEYGAGSRSVDVFYGARCPAELYALETLQDLARRHPWLAVHPVVSEQGVPPGGAATGELPEVVSRYAPWHGHDAYVSGPAAMVRRAVGVLQRSGVEAGRIHHDPVGDAAG
ncbi:globin domain-containing protein [Kitasatospora sp. NBC_01539]|uniref:globin domain-containing protein n=1 Tax=Kitasatospora sp. NBC_01539 TaxID=2903577 RepID=UPI003860096F